MLRLVIEDGEGTTHVVPLIRDEITIGREEGNTIRLTERNVSRRHARLVKTGTDASPTVLVEDLDSYNGLHLNGDKIFGKCTMRPSDLLQIGDYSLALKTEEMPDTVDRLPQTTADDEMPEVVDERLAEEECGRFVVVSSNLQGRSFALDRRELIIGRTESDENDMVIAHRSISRHHAKVIHRDGTFTIIDLASSNGVKVNGEAFGTATLVNGDIIELGHVKLRFCAPGDDYVFTAADVDDVEIESGPSVWQMVFVALLLVGVAVVAFLIVDRMDRGRAPDVAGQGQGQTGGPVTPTPPPAVDVAPLMAEGNAELRAERWASARQAFDKVLTHQPDHAEARAARARAQREAGVATQFDGLNRAVDGKRWNDALERLDTFPVDSVYTERAQALRPRVQQGWGDSQLERGRRMIAAGQLDEAESMHAKMGERAYAANQAKTLADEIARAREEAQRTPEQPVAVADNAQRDPDPPEPAANPERPADPVEKPPARRPRGRSAGGSSYEELIGRALKAMANGDRQRAIVLLESAAKKKPRSHVPYQRLCAVYKARGQYAKALRNCKKWLDREPNANYKPAIKTNIEQLQDLLGQ